MLDIALPKGRLGDRVYSMLKQAGYECPSIEQPDRRLIFENPETGVRYFWVKPSDVTIYVERGAADLGIAGKDILLENRPDLYELLDLKTGICRMAVAGPEGFADSRERTLRVATKFPHIAGNYYAARSRDVELIKLNGSIELAPILGLWKQGKPLQRTDSRYWRPSAQSAPDLWQIRPVSVLRLRKSTLWSDSWQNRSEEQIPAYRIHTVRKCLCAFHSSKIHKRNEHTAFDVLIPLML